MKPIKLKTLYTIGNFEADNPYIEPLFYPVDSIEKVKQDIMDMYVSIQQNQCERDNDRPNIILDQRFFVVYKLTPIQILDTKEEWAAFYRKHNFYKEKG